MSPSFEELEEQTGIRLPRGLPRHIQSDHLLRLTEIPSHVRLIEAPTVVLQTAVPPGVTINTLTLVSEVPIPRGHLAEDSYLEEIYLVGVPDLGGLPTKPHLLSAYNPTP